MNEIVTAGEEHLGVDHSKIFTILLFPVRLDGPGSKLGRVFFNISLIVVHNVRSTFAWFKIEVNSNNSWKHGSFVFACQRAGIVLKFTSFL